MTFNGEMYFGANDGVNGKELWKSDGSAAGTVLVKDMSPGTEYTGTDYWWSVHAIIGNQSYFPVKATEHSSELWVTDGTEAGTNLVKDINTTVYDNGEPVGSAPNEMINYNGMLYFTADDGIHGRELWKSDGTEAGTEMVVDLITNIEGYEPRSSVPVSLVVYNNSLYFFANIEPNPGYFDLRLFKSDGTAAGTQPINTSEGTLEPKTVTGSVTLVVFNGFLYFSAWQITNDINTGYELWKSDGTDAGTVLVKDITPGGINSNIHSLTVVDNTLYFVAYDNLTTGIELWKSDGTEAGTMIVKDIASGTDSSWPTELTAYNGRLYFTVSVSDGGPYGKELRRLDLVPLWGAGQRRIRHPNRAALPRHPRAAQDQVGG